MPMLVISPSVMKFGQSKIEVPGWSWDPNVNGISLISCAFDPQIESGNSVKAIKGQNGSKFST